MCFHSGELHITGASGYKPFIAGLCGLDGEFQRSPEKRAGSVRHQVPSGSEDSPGSSSLQLTEASTGGSINSSSDEAEPGNAPPVLSHFTGQFRSEPVLAKHLRRFLKRNDPGEVDRAAAVAAWQGAHGFLCKVSRRST